MTVIATSSTRFSDLVKHEYDPASAFCRDVVTVNDVAQTLKVGSVLGKVTATGKYKLIEATAADGSQTAAAVYIGDKDGYSYDLTVAATTDTPVLVFTRGQVILNKDYLKFGASVDTQGERDAIYASLKALGILVEEGL